MTLLQDRGSIGTENRLIAKNAMRNSSCRGCTCRKSVHRTRVERFWGEHSANVRKKFKQEFKRIEMLGLLRTTVDLHIW